MEFAIPDLKFQNGLIAAQSHMTQTPATHLLIGCVAGQQEERAHHQADNDEHAHGDRRYAAGRTFLVNERRKGPRIREP